MPKPIQLQIPKPCDASWNEMEKTDKGRFCLSCQKQVVDFSVMSDREILAYISKSKENLCGHFYPDQLNRDLSVKQERKLGWLRQFIHVMIPAIMIANKASAQVKFKGDTIICTPSEKRSITLGRLDMKRKIEKKCEIRSRVTDENNEPVCGATIATKTIDGNKKLESIIPMETTLMGGVAGGITIEKGVDTSIFRKIRKMIITPKKNIDTVKVYPNPISAGAVINLAFDINKTGEYSVAMINISGQPVLQKNIRLDNIKQIEQLPCDPRLPKGIYTLQVINLSTKKIYNNKVLVL